METVRPTYIMSYFKKGHSETDGPRADPKDKTEPKSALTQFSYSFLEKCSLSYEPQPSLYLY